MITRVSQFEVLLDAFLDILEPKRELHFNLLMSCLKALPEDIDDGSRDGLQRSNLFIEMWVYLQYGCECGSKMVIYVLLNLLQAGSVEEDYTLLTQFWTQYVEKHIKTLTLVELSH